MTLYPFLMMDAPGFPWRGRISSTLDKSASVRGAITSFFGTAQTRDFSLGAGESHHRATDDGYRNFILSHANLARRAGGVDRFLIGAEMKGLTRLRDAGNAFPAVEALMNLAADVRVVLGSNTGISYAADWSEYFGYHPSDGTGDVFFHLDPLWAHPAISAVGIDAYFPLSDWRDGEHLDADIADNIYDKDYLASNMEGGEGYDWYYVSASDRELQICTPITDGAENKPWVFRYKDIRSWWGQPHYGRTGDVEDAMPTAWVPKIVDFAFCQSITSTDCA